MAGNEKAAKDGREKDAQATKQEPAEQHQDVVREGYDAAKPPERQGDGDPGTEPVPGGSANADGDANDDADADT